MALLIRRLVSQQVVMSPIHASHSNFFLFVYPSTEGPRRLFLLFLAEITIGRQIGLVWKTFLPGCFASLQLFLISTSCGK